jgi:peptidoglycan-associated lipoprotein
MKKNVLLSVTLLSLLAACASEAPKTQAPAKVEEQPVMTKQQPAAETKPMEQQKVTVNPLTDPSNILSKRSVYYDFDKDNIKDEYKPMIEAHGKYLAEHSDVSLTLQGNADERGSPEYNLALGERRAESVKKMMKLEGAADGQMTVVSFGEEKPKATCHEESCWSQNRRTDIVYKGE